jgi:hypothetical protein
MADPFQVKFKLVADINKKGEGARVVPDTVRETKPRVDIKTEVETGGAKPIKTRQDDGKAQFDHTAGNASATEAQRDASLAHRSGRPVDDHEVHVVEAPGPVRIDDERVEVHVVVRVRPLRPVEHVVGLEANLEPPVAALTPTTEHP